MLNRLKVSGCNGGVTPAARLTQMHSPMTTFFALVDVPPDKETTPSLTPSCRPRTGSQQAAGALDLRRMIFVWHGAVPSCPPPTFHVWQTSKMARNIRAALLEKRRHVPHQVCLEKSAVMGGSKRNGLTEGEGTEH